MSVINQMLRDLDARDASEQERAGLPPRLRTLPPAGRAQGGQPWRLLVFGIAIGAAAAGAAISLLRGDDSPAFPGPAAPPVSSPAVLPAPTSPPAQAMAVEDGAMKLSTVIRNAELPAKPGSPGTPPSPNVSASGIPAAAAAATVRPVPAKPAKPAAAAATTPVAPATADVPDAHIDKRPKGGQLREMADVEYRKGMQAAKQGDPAAAAAAFQRALERDPGFSRARQALLATLVGSRQWAEARQVAEAGLALDPAQSGWAVILARLQFEQGDADAAIGTLERHAAHASGDADYQGLFAYLLQRQQRPAEAAERFRAGLALRPGEGRWWFGLGLALENGGKSAEAKEAYARARAAGNLPADMAAVIEQKLR